MALALPAGFPDALPRYRQDLGFAPFLGRAQQRVWRNPRTKHRGVLLPSSLFLLKSGEFHPLMSPAARGAVSV